MKSTVRETFAHNLTLARKRYGISVGDAEITQAAVAGLLGMEPERYRKYERGEREPPLDVLVMLSRFYTCSVDELLGLEPTRLEPCEAELLAMFRRTTDVNRMSLLNLVRGLPAAEVRTPPLRERARAKVQASLAPVVRRGTLHEDPPRPLRAKA